MDANLSGRRDGLADDTMTLKGRRQFRVLVPRHQFPRPAPLFGAQEAWESLGDSLGSPKRFARQSWQTTANNPTRSSTVPVPARFSKNAGSADTGNDRLLFVSLHLHWLDSLPRRPHRCRTRDLQTNKCTGTWHRPRGDQGRPRGIYLVGSTGQVHPERVQLPKGALGGALVSEIG